MSADPIPNRYELKYLVSEDKAARIQRAIQPFCAADLHAAKLGGRYIITSLYYDSPRLEFYRSKAQKAYHRLKLRVRTYGELSDGPVFLEVKRKYGDIIAKSRKMVDRVRWREHAQGDFYATKVHWQARPVLLARYEREPYFSEVDAYARVTFDRNIVYQACPTEDLLGDPREWRATDTVGFTGHVPGALVLELKCTQAVPRWMASLIRNFDLQRTGFSKYCTGVEDLYLNQGDNGGDRVARYGVN